MLPKLLAEFEHLLRAQDALLPVSSALASKTPTLKRASSIRPPSVCQIGLRIVQSRFGHLERYL